MLKVYVDVGEPNVTTNALDFETVDDAVAYGLDLYGRWTLVRRFFVLDVDAIGAIDRMRFTVSEAEDFCTTSGPGNGGA